MNSEVIIISSDSEEERKEDSPRHEHKRRKLSENASENLSAGLADTLAERNVFPNNEVFEALPSFSQAKKNEEFDTSDEVSDTESESIIYCDSTSGADSEFDQDVILIEDLNLNDFEEEISSFVDSGADTDHDDILTQELKLDFLTNKMEEDEESIFTQELKLDFLTNEMEEEEEDSIFTQELKLDFLTNKMEEDEESESVNKNKISNKTPATTCTSSQIASKKFEPQIASKKFGPQIASKTFGPQIASKKPVPQIASKSKTFHPQIASKKFEPQIASKKPEPQIGPIKLEPQVASKKFEPQIASKNLVPQIASKKPEPQIASTKPEPQIPIESDKNKPEEIQNIAQLFKDRWELILKNKENAFRIRLKKRKVRRLAQKQGIIKYTTKIKSKRIPKKMDQAPALPRLDESNQNIIPTIVSFLDLESDPRNKAIKIPSKKFFRILIDDFLGAEIKCPKPLMYKHNKIEFKYVNIIGTIVGIYTNVTEKIQLIIDDTTGRVTCVIEAKQRKQRRNISRRLEKWEKKLKEPRTEHKVKKPELLKIMGKSDIQFQRNLKGNKKLGADLLHTYGYILLRKAVPFLVDEYPSKANLSLNENSIGRHVSITGKAYEWTEERVVYAWNVKFITLDNFFTSVNSLLKEKSASSSFY